MHNWGEEGVDWKGIDDAATYIHGYCLKWAFLGGQSKEKYGTVRFYAHFGWLSLHGLIYPGYAWNQFPKWLWKLDCNIIGPALRFFFERPFVAWQRYIYKRAYRSAVRKWPHLKEEILVCADYPEFFGSEHELKIR